MIDVVVILQCTSSIVLVKKSLHVQIPSIIMNPLGHESTSTSANHVGGLPGVALVKSPCVGLSFALSMYVINVQLQPESGKRDWPDFKLRVVLVLCVFTGHKTNRW